MTEVHVSPSSAELASKTDPVGKTVLVVDTDPGVRWSLERGLRHSGYIVAVAATPEEALNKAYDSVPTLILLELMPEAGLSTALLSSLSTAPFAPQVVCASIDAPPHLVIECMRLGAVGFLPKPFSLANVRAELANALKARGAVADHPRHEPHETDSSLLVGMSTPMQELRATIRQVAQTTLNCLIRGDSGVGKDLVAREIHRLSARHAHPFVKVNCSALPEQLLESELFGYEKGAFTGATTSKPGRFSLANGGIIFLDEIAEIPLNIQAKLLQVIEHKEFTKLGGRSSSKVDVQIIAATNADIEARAREGVFRQDLFFRLNEVCIWVPALAARREDIPALIRHFVSKYRHFSNGTPQDLSGQDIATLCERPWPGNVRELESAVKRWMALHRMDTPAPAQTAAAASDEFVLAGATVSSADAELAERQRVLRVLDENQWNRRKAADALGMSYQALRRYIVKHNLDERPAPSL